MPADNGLLGVSPPPFGHSIACARCQFLGDDPFHGLLSQHDGLLLRRAGLKRLGRIVVILDKGR